MCFNICLFFLYSEIKIWVPDPDHSELPALWWDAIADKCLLLGIFKHGTKPNLLFNNAKMYQGLKYPLKTTELPVIRSLKDHSSTSFFSLFSTDMDFGGKLTSLCILLWSYLQTKLTNFPPAPLQVMKSTTLFAQTQHCAS